MSDAGVEGFVEGDVVAGRYRIVRLLGAGAMGAVYEAHDSELREAVALKIIRPSLASDSRVLERLRREIQLSRRVTHPNVCRIFDVTRDAERGIALVSMELLQGRTLKARLADGGPMTTAEALSIVRQLAAGLDAAHAASIVHREFNSANVILAPARAVITDFGVADETLTPATDVYALGTVLFEMMTGAPFDGTFSPDLDARWKAVILRCLDRDPAKRFASAGEVAAALDTSAPAPRTKPSRRWRVPLLLAASLLVIIFAVVMQRRPSPAPPPPAAPRAVAAAPFTPRRAVAVLGFRADSGDAADAWLAGAFTELMSNELSATETLRLVPGDDVAQMRADLSLPEGETIAGAALPRIRERLSADVVVSGSYASVMRDGAKQLRLDVRTQDTATGAILSTISESGTEGELFALVSRTGGRLRKELGAAPLTPEASAGLRASTPANADAARAYVEGLGKLRRFDALGARASLDRAVAAEPHYPMSHAALAEALWNLGSEKQATAAADQALALATKLGREERLSIEARAHVMHKEFDKAIEIYRSLLTFYPDELTYGLRLGTVQVSAGKAHDALATVDKLRALPEPMRGDPAIDLVAADAFHLTHENSKELVVAERAEAVGAASNMRGIVARAKANQAYAHRDLGHPDRSVALLEEAARMYEEMGDRAGSARCLSNLGLSLWNRGDLNAAEPLLERALIIHRQVGSRSFESRTLNNIGIIRFMKGNIEGAEKVWREALVVQRESNFLTAMAPTLANLGGTRQLQGDMDGAEKFYAEAIEVSRQTDDRFGEAMGLTNMAELLRLRGNLAASRQPYERGLALAQTLEMPVQESYSLAAMGDLALWQGDFAEARRLHTAAIGLRRKAKDKITTAQSQVMMANLSLEEGKPAEGEAPVREAIAVLAQENAAEEEAIAQEVLARIALARGKPADAEGALERARTLTAKSRTLSILSSIAATEARLLLARNEPLKALARANQAAVMAARSELLASELEARLVAATAQAQQGRAAAAQSMRAAIATRARTHGLLLIAKKAS